MEGGWEDMWTMSREQANWLVGVFDGKDALHELTLLALINDMLSRRYNICNMKSTGRSTTGMFGPSDSRLGAGKGNPLLALHQLRTKVLIPP